MKEKIKLVNLEIIRKNFIIIVVEVRKLIIRLKRLRKVDPS